MICLYVTKSSVSCIASRTFQTRDTHINMGDGGSIIHGELAIELKRLATCV